jgi:hypothetical protein
LFRPTYVAILVVSVIVVILCFAALSAVMFYTSKFTAHYYTHEDEREGAMPDDDNMPLTPTGMDDGGSNYPTLDAKIATIEEFGSGGGGGGKVNNNGAKMHQGQHQGHGQHHGHHGHYDVPPGAPKLNGKG